jgi:hypothetical protein
VEGFCGDLSFGSFEKAPRAAYGVAWDHPLRDRLRACLRSTRTHKAVAGIRLEAFVQLRNELGHALTPADEPRARTIFAEEDPIGGLIEIITGVQPILSLPLVVALEQHHRRGRFLARMAFYAGEGEPIPREVVLGFGIYEWEVAYLCTEQGLIPLAPGLLFQPQTDGRFGLFLIDGIRETEVRYKSVYDNTTVSSDRTIPDLARWVALPFIPPRSSHLQGPPIEQVGADDGRTLLALVRGDPVPATTVQRPEDAATTEVAEDDTGAEGVLTLGEFEHQANAAGVGSAYRDVIYFLLEMGHRAEVSAAGIRVVTASEPNRVLLTVSLRHGPELVVTILPGAFQTDEQNKVVRVVKPGEAADEVIQMLKSLSTRVENHFRLSSSDEPSFPN